ncbi:MAG: DsbA family protein [Pseudomonadales bacterium]|jgi:predicted DsbA family dithiol-disulfide isomerase
MKTPLGIEYYTDILCVWAWIAQRRIDELNQELGDRIHLQYHYMDVFGDVPTKMGVQWEGKGHYHGYARHVMDSAASFKEAPVNPKVWTEVRPASSANAHLALKAVELAYDRKQSMASDLMLRRAFFVDAQDIGNMAVILELLDAQGLDSGLIRQPIQTGIAMAALMGDYQKAKRLTIKGSPSYVIDGGRQTLYGNVGYRVIRANIEELLKQPMEEASWC